MPDDLTRRGFAGLSLAMASSHARAGAMRTDAALDLVDPELRAPLVRPELIRIPSMKEADIPAYRDRVPAPSPPLRAAPAVSVRQIAGPAGAALRVFIVNAAGRGARPAILHIHGGGYILGSPPPTCPTFSASPPPRTA